MVVKERERWAKKVPGLTTRWTEQRRWHKARQHGGYGRFWRRRSETERPVKRGREVLAGSHRIEHAKRRPPRPAGSTSPPSMLNSILAAHAGKTVTPWRWMERGPCWCCSLQPPTQRIDGHATPQHARLAQLFTRHDDGLLSIAMLDAIGSSSLRYRASTPANVTCGAGLYRGQKQRRPAARAVMRARQPTRSANRAAESYLHPIPTPRRS